MITTVCVFYEDGDYIATLKDRPTLSGIGATPEDALREFRVALRLAQEAIGEDPTLERLEVL